MPYYRRRRYGYSRKRTYGKRKTGWWKRKSKKYTGEKGIRFFKLRATIAVDSDAGGVISGGANNSPSGYQDWTSISNLFDSYRACGIAVKYIPDKPNDLSATTGYKPLYVVGDPNSPTQPLTSTNTAIQYENMKVVNMYRPWKYWYKFPKVASVPLENNIILQGGFQSSSGANTNAFGGVWWYGTGYDVSDNYGTMIVTLYMMARDRR